MPRCDRQSVELRGHLDLADKAGVQRVKVFGGDPVLQDGLAADLVNGAVMALLALLAALRLLEIWHVYLATTIFGLVEAFFFPAYSAAVPELSWPTTWLRIMLH